MKAKTHFFYFLLFIFFLQTVLVSVAAAAAKIMPLGDSITRGSNPAIPDPDYIVGYRQTLYLDLIDEGYDVYFVGGEQEGERALPAFDIDHEGHGGWEADEIVNGNPLDPDGKLDQWLAAHEPDIVLLHIGTNDISDGEDPDDIVLEVKQILDEIFAYDPDTSVILARIINRQIHNQNTTAFNNLLPGMVNGHPNRNNIFIVDQESALTYPDDLGDEVHPNVTGYSKMADVWFSALLEDILPAADAGSNQSVDEGVTVTLDGSNSNDPGFNPISSYFWEQTGGKLVTISDPAVVEPTFTAPDVGSQGETLTFRLTVTYSDSFESTDTTNVTVNGHSSLSSTGCFIGTVAR